MAAKRKRDETRTSDVARMKAQVNAWSVQLDELVAGAVASGAQTHDPYRVRIEALKPRLAAVQASLDAFDAESSTREEWRALRAEIRDDWTALEDEFKALKHED